MKLSDAARRMMLVLCISLPVVVAGAAVYYYYRPFSFMPFIFGVVWGNTLNSVKVFMIDRAIKRIVNMDTEMAGNYVRFQYFLRFLLTGLVLASAALIPFINLWGTVIGVLVYPVAVYFLKGFREREKNE